MVAGGWCTVAGAVVPKIVAVIEKQLFACFYIPSRKYSYPLEARYCAGVRRVVRCKTYISLELRPPRVINVSPLVMFAVLGV